MPPYFSLLFKPVIIFSRGWKTPKNPPKMIPRERLWSPQRKNLCGVLNNPRIEHKTPGFPRIRPPQKGGNSRKEILNPTQRRYSPHKAQKIVGPKLPQKRERGKLEKQKPEGKRNVNPKRRIWFQRTKPKKVDQKGTPDKEGFWFSQRKGKWKSFRIPEY